MSKINRNSFFITIFAAAFIIIAIFVASYQVVWEYIPHFDKLLHITGGVIAAWLVSSFLTKNKSRRFKQLGIMLGCVLLIGIIWEILEYLSGVYGPTYWPIVTKYFYGGDFWDSMGDLCADTIGAFIYFLLISNVNK